MINTDLSVNFIGVNFDNCLLNASGCLCTQLVELKELDDSDSGGIVCKSCSYSKRLGNPCPRYFSNHYGTLNSMGLPNEGYQYYVKLIGEFAKPYAISVAGNLHNLVFKYLTFIKFLTAINSVGNALIIDGANECVRIKPKNGLGGLGGKYIKPIALSNVWQLYNRFGDSVKIIGCGGIKSGMDVFEHILCGATLCQIGSQLLREGPSCFERIQRELKEIMEDKGYTQISDYRGKLFKKKF